MALTRRQFTLRVGTGLGAAAAAGAMAPTAFARRPRSAPADAIQLNSNENPWGPFPRALQAFDRGRAAAARYPDAAETATAEAIARHHGVTPEEVVLGCGSSEILQVADMAFLAPGRKVVAAEPTFEAVLAYARLTRAEPVKVPLTADHRHDLARMATACDASTGLVYVCNPNNPTGTIVTRAELEAFLAAVPAGTVVLVDEAYHHFVEDPAYTSALDLRARHPNVVVARTFSKIYGLAGMRLGYAVASPENARAMREHLVWSNANAAVLEAAQASLADAGQLDLQRRRFAEVRRWLCEQLARDGRRYIPSQTNFVMIDVGGDVQPLIDAFRERGILVGRRFPTMESWLRISIGTPEQMKAFVSALRALRPARA